MSLRTYLDAAWKDGKAPIDPSTLVIFLKFYFSPNIFSIFKLNSTLNFSLESCSFLLMFDNGQNVKMFLPLYGKSG